MPTIIKTSKAILFIALFVFLCNPAYAIKSAPPSNETINKWWKKHSTEEITLNNDKISLITLLNNEIAYLMKVELYGRGRNFFHQVLLIRPELQEVKLVGDPMTHNFEVRNLDPYNDHVSEIITESIGSGQGTTIGKKSIIQLDGWKPKILHQAEFKDNLGACGPSVGGIFGCYSKEIVWLFTNIDKKVGDDLLEAVIVNEGPDEMKTSIQINTYTFKDGLFTKTNTEVNSNSIHVPSEKPSPDTN